MKAAPGLSSFSGAAKSLSDPDPEVERKLKVAFAEGYKAREENTKKRWSNLRLVVRHVRCHCCPRCHVAVVCRWGVKCLAFTCTGLEIKRLGWQLPLFTYMSTLIYTHCFICINSVI